MTGEQDLIALYRAGATEEPDPSLDGVILRAAQRRRILPLAGMVFATAACAALAITFVTQHAPLDRPQAVSAMPGLNEGRERFIARDLSPATQSPGPRPAEFHGATQ